MAYKRVVLIGDNIDSPVDSEVCNNNCLIIGSKENGFSLEDLNMLKGKVDSNTRIDISAHGDTEDGQHFFSTDGGLYLTSDLLAQLSYLSGNKPLYIHLWSCYGGAADKEVYELPIDSILITHIPSKHPASVALDAMAIKQSFTKMKAENDNKIDELISNILLNSVSIMSININSRARSKKFQFGHDFVLRELISDPKKYVYEKLEALKLNLENEGIKVKVHEFPSEELWQFVQGYLIYLATINDGELRDFLENPSVSQNTLKELLDDNSFGTTLLFQASYSGHAILVKQLIEVGAKLDIQDHEGVTALYLAAQNGHDTVVKLLIDAGTNLDFQNHEGVTALYGAAQNGHDAVVKLLIDAGADLDIQDNEGVTPLYLAAQSGHDTVVKLLIEAGANPNIQSNVGVTSLYIAAQEGQDEAVKLLVDAGADIRFKTSFNDLKSLDIAICLDHNRIAQMLFKQHLKIENNIKAFINQTAKSIVMNCPTELSDFKALVDQFLTSEHLHSDL